VHRVTFNAIDPETHVVERLVVKRFAIETFTLLTKLRVALTAVGIRKGRRHPIRLFESSAQIEKRVFSRKQFHPCSTQQTDSAVTIDASHAGRSRSTRDRKTAMARGQARERACIEVFAKSSMQRPAIGQVTGVAEVIVCFEDVGGPPACWNSQRHPDCRDQQPQCRTRGST